MRPGRSTTFQGCLDRGARALGRGATGEAVEWFRAATALEAKRPEGFLNLAAALRGAGRPDEAVVAARSAVSFAPHSPEARLNLGHALAESGAPALALGELRAAIALRPSWPPAWTSLGAVRLSLGEVEGATAELRRAGELAPDWYLPRFNLALALAQQGRDEEAIAALRATLERAPDFAGAHLELAYLLLRHGQFAEGWRELEWRHHGESLVSAHRPMLLWTGQREPKKTLLVRFERGLGDLIHFVRFVRPARRLVGRVVVEAPECLRSLIASCPGVDAVIDPEQPYAEADLQVALFSLPRWLGATAESLDVELPYLSPPEATRSSLDGPRPAALRVGVAWTGSPAHPQQARRSCLPGDFAPLSRIPGVELVSLQYRDAGVTATELRRCGIRSLGEEIGDFSAVAAIVRRLDLVVTVDTSVAHLAGALGGPVFLLLHDHPDWRWMTDPSRTLWYPTVELFRRRRGSGWGEVMARVGGALRQRLGPRRHRKRSPP